MSLGTPPESTTDCIRCGYDLRGIADDQPCPECGLLALRSRRAFDELHETSPKWLASISWGVNSILLAIVLGVGWMMIWDRANRIINFYTRWQIRQRYFAWAIYPALLAAGFMFAAIFLVAGIFLLTRPEGHASADRSDRSLRKSLRAAAILVLTATELCVLNRQAAFGNGSFLFLLPYASNWGLASLILLMLAMAALVWLVFKYFRTIAAQARSAHLAEHCALVGRGAAAAFAYAAVVILLAGRGDAFWGPNWVNRSMVAMGLALIFAVLAGLFVVWSFYLLLRFGISFRRAASLANEKWHRDDRSLEPQ